jgi:hypothetical protein
VAGAAVPAWLRRWGISIASLVGGSLTLFVFRRGVPHVGWIVGYVMGLWLLFTVLAQARRRLLRRGHHLVLSAGEYTIQTLYHGLLLFVLPGYLASTTFDAPTAGFSLLVAAAALVTTIDPWYRGVVHPRPWLGRAFFGFSLFAGLNLALPLIGVPPAWSVPMSAALAILALAPTWAGGPRPVRGLVASLLGAAAGGGAAWVLAAAVPPAPLHLVRPTLARDVILLEAVDPLGPEVSAAHLGTGEGLVAYTPVAAPVGLRQPILHRWRHEGRVVTSVSLPTPVQGGRPGGFRTYSRKTDFPADPRGRWTVDVVTASGQLVGRLRFTVGP